MKEEGPQALDSTKVFAPVEESKSVLEHDTSQLRIQLKLLVRENERLEHEGKSLHDAYERKALRFQELQTQYFELWSRGAEFQEEKERLSCYIEDVRGRAWQRASSSENVERVEENSIDQHLRAVNYQTLQLLAENGRLSEELNAKLLHGVARLREFVGRALSDPKVQDSSNKALQCLLQQDSPEALGGRGERDWCTEVKTILGEMVDSVSEKEYESQLQQLRRERLVAERQCLRQEQEIEHLQEIIKRWEKNAISSTEFKEAELGSLSQQLKVSEAKIEATTLENEKLRAIVATLSCPQTPFPSEINNHEYQQLEDEVNILRGEKDTYTKMVSELQQAFERSKAQTHDALAAIQSIRSEHCQLKEMKEMMETENDDLKRTNEKMLSLRWELETLREQHELLSQQLSLLSHIFEKNWGAPISADELATALDELSCLRLSKSRADQIMACQRQKIEALEVAKVQYRKYVLKLHPIRNL